MATTISSSNVPSTSNTSVKTSVTANSMISTTATTSSEAPQLVDVIPQQTIKNLSDKRKQAGEEIEALVKKFVANKEKENIKILIFQILKLTNSIQQPQRKAGLWALSAVSVGLVKDIKDYFPDLLPIILQAVKDSDPKSRVFITYHIRIVINIFLILILRISSISCLRSTLQPLQSWS